MQLEPQTLPGLAQALVAERRRQGLSREQAAAVCNVSESFIRDAESDPGSCSLAKLLQLTYGMGLTFTLTGWQLEEAAGDAGAPAKARAA
ncbi:helix-turn-helix domain-containing protein [Polaromonas sp. YR568]|uniref:helix-turn-helix domain-containing protein n=1 Tax=Polaromonas sp. YR568 TaxID=1855301 RepID=UPI00398C1E88